jgi:hypothetical protein
MKERPLMSRLSISRTILVGGISLTAAALLGWNARPAASKIAGSFDVTYAEQHPLAVPDAAGHAILLARARGVNRSTGPTSYMDRGEVSNLEFADLVQGNGPQQGYVSMSQGADTMISKWSGKVTTTMSSDRTPIVTFEGNWTKAKGTGRYARTTGAGTYKGHFTSPTTYTVDWSGEISGESHP